MTFFGGNTTITKILCKTTILNILNLLKIDVCLEDSCNVKIKILSHVNVFGCLGASSFKAIITEFSGWV